MSYCYFKEREKMKAHVDTLKTSLRGRFPVGNSDFDFATAFLEPLKKMASKLIEPLK